MTLSRELMNGIERNRKSQIGDGSRNRDKILLRFIRGKSLFAIFATPSEPVT